MHMKRLLTLGGACLLGLGIATGCHRTTDTVAVGESLGTEYKWIQTDSGLNEMAHVVSAHKDRVNGLLKVQVEVVNLRNHDERIVYKLHWLDANGMEITSVSNDWVPLVINGRESAWIQGIAPDPRVTDCRVKIQENIR
jgi:uncharacterized protein YcfL